MAKRPEIAVGINRKRARIQGSIAACTQMKAELNKAREIAQSAAIDEAHGNSVTHKDLDVIDKFFFRYGSLWPAY
jgi:hypothetical protein